MTSAALAPRTAGVMSPRTGLSASSPTCWGRLELPRLIARADRRRPQQYKRRPNLGGAPLPFPPARHRRVCRGREGWQALSLG